MHIPLLQVDFYSWEEQIDKIYEEFDEFMIEQHQSEDEIAECLDLLTAIFTFLTHSYDKDQIDEALKNHRNKLKKRNWSFKGDIKLDIQYWD